MCCADHAAQRFVSIISLTTSDAVKSPVGFDLVLQVAAYVFACPLEAVGRQTGWGGGGDELES